MAKKRKPCSSPTDTGCRTWGITNFPDELRNKLKMIMLSKGETLLYSFVIDLLEAYTDQYEIEYDKQEKRDKT